MQAAAASRQDSPKRYNVDLTKCVTASFLQLQRFYLIVIRQQWESVLVDLLLL